MRLVCLLVLLFAADPAAAGKLDDVRDEVRGSDSSDSSSSSDYCDDDDDDDDDYYGYNDGDSIPGEAVVALLFFPFFVPFDATGDCYGGDYVYSWYPYASNQPTALTSTCLGFPGSESVVGQSWSAQLIADVVPQVDDDILRLDASVRVQTPMRLEIDSTWSHLRERLPEGVDHLTIGDLNFVARFAQSSSAQFRAGLGVRLMLDAEGRDVGFNFTYGLDLFPVEPWVISASLDLGNLGFAAYFQGRFTVGVTLLGGEMFAGWDHIQVGGVSLTGPVVGARVWF